MANNKNLKPISSVSEAREKGKKGGKASAKKRAEKRLLKDELLILLDEGDTRKKLSVALINKALSGDTKAYEIIRDTIGQKPIDKQEVNINPPIIVDSIEDIPE